MCPDGRLVTLSLFCGSVFLTGWCWREKSAVCRSCWFVGSVLICVVTIIFESEASGNRINRGMRPFGKKRGTPLNEPEIFGSVSGSA